MSLPPSAGSIPTSRASFPMSDERTHVTPFEFARWLVPSLLVLLGVVCFFIYASAAPAIISVSPTP
jgi:hypothetical protein